MLKQSTALPAKKKVMPNRLVMGFAALAATAVIGTTGIAAAAQKTSPAHGYGGSSSGINIGPIEVHGNNNVINIIINVFR
jgi:hypothetical protein